jgi:hypothetical protein
MLISNWRARRSIAPGLLALAALVASGRASAQPAAAPPAAPAPAPAAPPAPAPAAASPAAPSADDLAEIQRALGADQAELEKTTPPPPPPSPPSAVTRAIQSLNPHLSFIGDFALAAFSRSDNLEQGGHDPSHSGFNLQSLELAASADVDPYFRFNANIVFGEEGVEVEEAYATTTALPGSLQVRAGQFLTRFGRINATHPHQWDFVDQPFVITKMLGPDGNRGVGVELSWLTPLPWYVEVVLSETQATGACCARSFYGDDDLGVRGPQDLETMLAIKQFHALSEDWSLSTGLSGALGPNPTRPGAESLVLGADLYLKYRPITRESTTIVSLQAEGLTRRRETPAGTLSDTGLYAQLLWRFAQRWTTGARYELASGTADDYLDPYWTSERQRVAAALTFFPTEFSRLRLQGNADLPSFLPSPIWGGFLALEISAGAHGAHAF